MLQYYYTKKVSKMQAQEKEVLNQALNPLQGKPLEELQETATLDYKKLEVLHLCAAEGREEFCISYSPGPAGNCTFQDLNVIVNNKPLCKKS